MIDGFIKYHDIANCFSHSFRSVYIDSPSNDALKQKFVHNYHAYYAKHCFENLTPHLFSQSDMLDAVFNLKVGKSASPFIKAEHPCYIHLLFNALLTHSYLPYDFLCGNISPIVKDSNGDTTSTSNYLPIILGPTFSQLFEHLLFNKFGHYLESDNLQFGFKQKHSPSHTLFILKLCVEYYTKHG